jgi:quinol monooxygenase YgiN
MVSTGLLTQFEVHPDSEAELDVHLRNEVETMRARPGTAAWFSFRFHRHDFGSIAVFPDDASRREHLGADRLRAPSDRIDSLLERPATETKLDVFASKLTEGAPPARKGLLVTFSARHDRDEEVQRFLMDASEFAAAEPGTIAWFAVGVESGEYGIFDVFPDSSARRRHLLGHVPRELAKESFSLLGSVPEMHFLDVVSSTLDPLYADSAADS